jgi:hypothetical protein
LNAYLISPSNPECGCEKRSVYPFGHGYRYSGKEMQLTAALGVAREHQDGLRGTQTVQGGPLLGMSKEGLATLARQ